MDKKKEFAKVIAAIRKDIRAELGVQIEYPKAMMTGQQERKGTATVNCGGEWCNTATAEKLAETVMNDERFQKYLKDFNCTAAYETLTFYGRTAWQVRLHFKSPEIKRGAHVTADGLLCEVVEIVEDEGVWYGVTPVTGYARGFVRYFTADKLTIA